MRRRHCPRAHQPRDHPRSNRLRVLLHLNSSFLAPGSVRRRFALPRGGCNYPDRGGDRIEQERSAARCTFDDAAKARVLALANDFPAVWNDPASPARERKRMVAMLIADVTLDRRDEHIHLGIRFRGGARTTVTVPVPLSAWRRRQTHPNALARATTLLHEHTDARVADMLNGEGFVTGAGDPFDSAAVKWIRRRWRLPSYRDHLLAAGKLTASQLAPRLGISETQLRVWRRTGRVNATCCSNKIEYLYDPIEQQPAFIGARATPDHVLEPEHRSPRTTATRARGAV